MGDYSKAHLIASEISEGKSPRRTRAVNNIVSACEKLIAESSAINYSSVAQKIKSLGLEGGPKAQSIYNTDDLRALINAFAEEGTPKRVARSAKTSFSTDEEEILDALPSSRLRSMFRDIVTDRSKTLTQMRLLDGFVSTIKKSGAIIDGANGNAVVSIGAHSKKEQAIVRDFFEVLFDYGFDLEDGEIVKGGKPTGSRGFVDLLQKRGLL